jgi:hypothetical protein
MDTTEAQTAAAPWKGTWGLEGIITDEQSGASRAPAGALAVWGGSVPVVAPPANLF